MRLTGMSMAIAALALAAGLHAAAQGSGPEAASIPKGEEIDVRPAMAAATEWLALVDQGRYADSWEQGAGALRSAVPRPDWEKALVAARLALGRFLGRKLVAATYTRELPNAPAGEYVVIQYQARYENKAFAVETVTPMREADGRWRVSGFYIR